MRRVVRVVAIFAGIVVLLLSLAAALIHTPAAKRFAFEQIRQALANEVIALDAARFDYNLFALRASSSGLSIRSALTPDLPPFFTADDIRA